MRGELASLIRRRRLWNSPLAVRGYRAARRSAERVGVQVLLKTFYSPIPDLATLPPGIWDRADPMHGIQFDLDSQLDFVVNQLAPAARAFTPTGSPGHAFDMVNDSYPVPDARLLYAMVRYLKPALIVELGSGQTTRVLAQACAENRADGHAARLTAYDPYPTAIDAALPGLDGLEGIPTQDLADEVFTQLQDGDLLFIDTTHTVKINSDVNRIILRALPLLAPGVTVHFHDICLPYEYPRYLFEDYALYWQEQYLLQAFLALNPAFEVRFAANALCRDRPDSMQGAGVIEPGESGSSFWITRYR